MIYLHGKLGAQFGKEHNFKAGSAVKALRYLRSKNRDLPEAIKADAYYSVRYGSSAVGESDLASETDRDIHITPVVRMKGRGAGMAILGAALITTGFMTGGAGFGLATAFAGGGGYSGLAVTMGVSFALSGIGQMLAPSIEPGEAAKTAESNILSGNINSTKAGAAVPLVYGLRVRTGSAIIAADVEIEETL